MTSVPVIVPDASVILKWVLPPAQEPDASRALALRQCILNDEVRPVVPALWLYEVGNTVARRFPEHASAWLTALVDFELEEAAPTRRWLSTTLKLIRRHGVTFYDAAYHAVAIDHGGVFLTADARYLDRAGKAGSVSHLADWSPP